MDSRLKKLILSKLIPYVSCQETVLPRLKNIHFSYKHAENSFIVYVPANNVKSATVELPLHQEQGDKYLKVNIDRDSFVKNVLESITKRKPEPETQAKKVVIDFSSPNIAKPFHMGHLRSTIIGNFIANINKYYNNDVIKINYLGDWGTQFGLLQYGLEAQNVDTNTLKTNPIKTLYEAYVYANKLAETDESVQLKARQYFSDIEQGKKDLDNWKNIRQITVEELEIIYNRLGIKFDDYHWESDYRSEAIKDVIKLLEKNEILREDGTGKKVATVNNRDVAVLRSDNSTLYLSRDIAALLDRYKRYKFDKMLYVVDNSQTDHFAGLFDIVKRLNRQCAGGCEHIKFGKIKGMSTRAGNVVFLNDILDEAKKKMSEQQLIAKNTRSAAMNEDTCDILGTTAVIINDLKRRRQRDYSFNWDKVLQTEGDSVKLQYLHCRLWSLERNSGASLPDFCDPGYLPEEVIGDILVVLAAFENTLQKSLEEYEASILINYLFRLSKNVNRMYKELPVKNESADLASQRLLVYHSARLVLRTGLEILGLKPLNEM